MGNVYDAPITVVIPNTRRKVHIRGIKPGTIAKLTMLWLERENALAADAAGTMKDLCKEPYFAVKVACLFCPQRIFPHQVVLPYYVAYMGQTHRIYGRSDVPNHRSG